MANIQNNAPMKTFELKTSNAPPGEGELKEASATTMMIRHIPCTSDDFLQIVNLHGFKGCYDYYYRPMDYTTGFQRSYAFMNFASPLIAKAFELMFDGMRLSDRKEHEPGLSVFPSFEQGLGTNVCMHYARKATQRRKHKRVLPLFLYVDSRDIPRAEAEAERLIRILQSAQKAPKWERAAHLFHEVVCQKAVSTYQDASQEVHTNPHISTVHSVESAPKWERAVNLFREVPCSPHEGHSLKQGYIKQPTAGHCACESLMHQSADSFQRVFRMQ